MKVKVIAILHSKFILIKSILAVSYFLSCLSVSAQHTKLFDFNGIDGSEPWGSLISDGTFLYGMTGEGGVNNNGVIFKILPNGSGYAKLFDFEAATSGNFAPGSLVYDGTFLYGMTTAGGANGLGTMFKIRPDGTGFVKLLDFAGSTNGARPEGSLFSDGTFLYGMTARGGSNDLGTIFKILPDGTGYIKLLDFTGTANGATPQGSLISDGTFLYGMTSGGGSTNNGTIFKILKDGTGYARLLNFNGAGNGREPFGTLLFDGTFLYGMTIEGGSINDGVIFKIRPDGTGYVKLFDFDINNQHASTPFGDLVTDGVYLYGMTYFGGVGGTHDYGRLFKILQDGTGFEPLFDFTTNDNGWLPYGSPLLIGSTLYGMTQQGGTAGGGGTIFRYQLPALENFITQWNLATAGSGATQLSFGTATSGSVNYTWQEISPGSASGSGSWSGPSLTITGLPAGATIRLQIAPTNFQRIIINSGTDSNRLTLVEQWGGTVWTSMQGAFYDCQNLQITATDVPNLSSVANMSEMFSGCNNLNSPINMGSWNTALITNMEFMFYGATAFNQNISGWNTGAVTTMSTMFSEAAAFNQAIGSWNTGAVTDMSGMFQFSSAFNQNISAWNTAAVTDMSSMFAQATAFNQNIAGWNTGAVTDMRGMFRLAVAFNQNLGAWELHPTVDVRNIFDDSGMGCNNYSATLIGWSANPSTPNGRQLGATGRQYGTNAVAARTNLTTTKGWTITGDTPSGAVCGSVSVPTITSFTPTSGPVGTTVIITGTNFHTTPANNTVAFNGTTAIVTASTATSITTTVPTGATTGKITVTVTGNTATSTLDFTVSSTANQPPIIEPTITAVPIEGIITLDLEPLISDPDDNLDPNSLYLVNSVSEQGASASLNNAFILTLDYGGIQFFGTDRIAVGVCDLVGECVEQELTVEVGGDVVVYNAVSADGNGLNDTFFLQYIDILPNTASNHVSIFNRWGDLVFEMKNYNNQDRVFKGLSNSGKELPSGTYYYKIEFSGKTKTGYLSLKR